MDHINKVKLGDKEYNIGGVYSVSIKGDKDPTIGDILDQLPIDKEIGSINLFTVIIGDEHTGMTLFGYVEYSPDSGNHYFKLISRFPNFTSKEAYAETYEDLAEMHLGSPDLDDEPLGNYAPSTTDLLPEETYDLKYKDGQVQ